MNNTKKHIRLMLVCFCILFGILCTYLVYVINIYGTRWFTNPYNTRISAQKENVEAGEIQDRNGIVLAASDASGKRIYPQERSVRRATSHVVGDNYGQTFGAETFFAKYILGFDQSFFERVSEVFSGKTKEGSDVSLTIDANLSEYVYDMMDENYGAIVVMNYKTGEILASVSQPTFDPKYMAEYLSGERELASSGMVNRVTMGKYPPGSTFKIVTLVAALRYIDGVEDRLFECDGPLVFDAATGKYLPDVHISEAEDKVLAAATPNPEISPEITPDPGSPSAQTSKYSYVRDYQSDYHGEITLKEAFRKSCNHVFAQLAMEIGSKRMQQVAEELGFNEDFLFEDMVVYSSSYEKAKTDYDLAWSGVGQYTDLATPLHMCMISAAIANDGIMMEPKLLRNVISPQGTVTKTLSTKIHSAKLSVYELEVLQEYMLSVVESGTGTRVQIDGYEVGGKTGTAEISSDKNVKTHAWFTGFVKDDDHPLAIAVIMEKAGSGGSVAGPIAAKVLEKAIELGN